MSYVQEQTFDTRRVVNRPSFFVQPLSRTKMTLLKAPMAHKTFSQEQYMFRFYSLTVAFDGQSLQSIPTSLNQSLFLTSSLRNFEVSMETNLLVLSRFRISFPSEDLKFTLVV